MNYNKVKSIYVKKDQSLSENIKLCLQSMWQISWFGRERRIKKEFRYVSSHLSRGNLTYLK